jgi:bifunctional NMN adenylyltransferase/nudix hydrolase
MKYSVLLGRFQLPHYGHFDLIKEGLKEGDHLIVGVGSSNVRRSLRNPFDFTQRVCMIENSEQDIDFSRITFVPLSDYTYNDTQWIEHVQRTVRGITNATSDANIAMVGHTKDETSYYLKMFPQWKSIEFHPKHIFNSTELRECYYEYGLEDKSYLNKLHDYTSPGVIKNLKQIVPNFMYLQFRDRYLWVKEYRKEYGTGPFETADAVVIKSGNILLIQRGQEPDKGSWALPGGFLNTDEIVKQSYMTAAMRELFEETGLDLSSRVRSLEIKKDEFNAKHRDDRADIKTHAFLFNLGMGKLPTVIGADDAANAKWVPLSDLSPLNMYADHYFIIKKLIAGL